MLSLSGNLYFSQPEEAIRYANRALELSRELNYKRGEASALKSLGNYNYYAGKYLETVKYWEESLKLCEEVGDKTGVANILSNLGGLNSTQGDDTRALELLLRSLDISEEINDTLRIVTALINIGLVYLNKPSTHDIALEYNLRALELSEEIGNKAAIGTVSLNIGEIYLESKDYTRALNYFERSYNELEAAGNIFYPLLDIGKVYSKQGDLEMAIHFQTRAYEKAKKVDAKLDMAKSLLGLADTYLQMNDTKMALRSFNEAKSIAEELNANLELRDSYKGLAELYAKTGDYKNAYLFQTQLTDIKDTISVIASQTNIGLIRLNYDLDKKQSEIELLESEKLQKIQQTENQRLWILIIAIALLSALLLSFMLYRNIKHKQKANVLLRKQKTEIQDAMKKLREAQSQLIQAEKMASLGELTAGIAHEIQNPLNFVNNFSDINKELLYELIEEVEKDNQEEVIAIANDVIENENKINHHGKRAESIVRNMLLHSRGSAGQKELVDINTLCNEYLRLAYHGFRAKDKSFNVDYQLEADELLPKIEVVPQDFGRVLLNLLNNAFYAVSVKSADPKNKSYSPSVKISTKYSSSKEEKPAVKICIRDNGNGIPDNLKDKIFQPFITTKPTGQGTGLGLSISYDIIKAHGGELTFETKEGTGSEFTIILPEG